MSFIDNSFLYRCTKWTRRRVWKGKIFVLLACIAVAIVISTAGHQPLDVNLTEPDVKLSPTFYISKNEQPVESEEYPTLENWQALSNGKFNLGKYEHTIIRVAINKDMLTDLDTWRVVIFRNNIFTQAQLYATQIQIISAPLMVKR